MEGPGRRRWVLVVGVVAVALVGAIAAIAAMQVNKPIQSNSSTSSTIGAGSSGGPAPGSGGARSTVPGRPTSSVATGAPSGTAGQASPGTFEIAPPQLVSTEKVCQLTGEYDKQTSPPSPTVNQTATNWGLVGTDNGFSFEYGGRLWFLFGDSSPTPKFRHRDNTQNVPLRNPGDNDSIAYSSDTAVDGCVHLAFIPDAIGAFARPNVLTQPGQAPVTLRTNEVPEAGISEGGNMYVVFGTDNFASNPPGGSGQPNGGPTRSVVGVALNGAQDAQFRYLYDLSTRPNGKFTFVTLANDIAGYVDFWGADAGGSSYRHSPAYFARKPADELGQPGGLQYFSGTDASGLPEFSSSEAGAKPIVSDAPADCIGEMSVQWNAYLGRWIMLYNCADDTPRNPRGIYMRLASAPWGPWSQPTTIFSTKAGLCAFIHRAVRPGQPACDQLSAPNRSDIQGGDYAPYMIGRFTTGTRATSTAPASTTIYYTMSTWNPYQVVIMATTVQG